MRLYKRGKNYWFELEFEGKRYRNSTKVAIRVKAEGIAAKFLSALAERRVGIIERKPLPMFETAMKEFLGWSQQEHAEHPNTFKRYRTSSKPLLNFLKFKGKSLDSITPNLVEEYKGFRSRQNSKRAKKPIKPATVNRELACLRRCSFISGKPTGISRIPSAK